MPALYRFFSPIILFLFVCELSSQVYSLHVSIREARLRVLLINPGLISLLPLFFPYNSLKTRLYVFVLSIIVTVLLGLWPLSLGNKELILGVQLSLFLFFLWGYNNNIAIKRISLLFACIVCGGAFFGIFRQLYLERQFQQHNYCIDNKRSGCGMSSVCSVYIDIKECGSNQPVIYDLYHGEGYAFIKYGYERGMPLLYLNGGGKRMVTYALCKDRLERVFENENISCE